MKSKILMILLSGVCIFSSSICIADHHHGYERQCVFEEKILSPSQIEKNTQSLGYSVVNEYFERHIKLEKGCIYKVKARDEFGQRWKLYFDPITGELIGKKRDWH